MCLKSILYISVVWKLKKKSGINIVEFLEKNSPAHCILCPPGPRLTVIDPALTERIYKLSPVLHLNETEALEVSGETDIRKAGAYLYRKIPQYCNHHPG